LFICLHVAEVQALTVRTYVVHCGKRNNEINTQLDIFQLARMKVYQFNKSNRFQ